MASLLADQTWGEYASSWVWFPAGRLVLLHGRRGTGRTTAAKLLATQMGGQHSIYSDISVLGGEGAPKPISEAVGETDRAVRTIILDNVWQVPGERRLAALLDGCASNGHVPRNVIMVCSPQSVPDAVLDKFRDRLTVACVKDTLMYRDNLLMLARAFPGRSAPTLQYRNDDKPTVMVFEDREGALERRETEFVIEP